MVFSPVVVFWSEHDGPESEGPGAGVGTAGGPAGSGIGGGGRGGDAGSRMRESIVGDPSETFSGWRGEDPLGGGFRTGGQYGGLAGPGGFGLDEGGPSRGFPGIGATLRFLNAQNLTIGFNTIVEADKWHDKNFWSGVLGIPNIEDPVEALKSAAQLLANPAAMLDPTKIAKAAFPGVAKNYRASQFIDAMMATGVHNYKSIAEAINKRNPDANMTAEKVGAIHSPDWSGGHIAKGGGTGEPKEAEQPPGKTRTEGLATGEQDWLRIYGSGGSPVVFGGGRKGPRIYN